jgi:hypothetical protein
LAVEVQAVQETLVHTQVQLVAEVVELAVTFIALLNFYLLEH